MRPHLIMLVIILNCCAISYGSQVKLVKNQDIYTIECPDVYYDLLSGKNNYMAWIDSTSTAPIDTIITVQNQGDTLSVFISNRGFVAFCLYQAGEYKLEEVQTMYYDENLKYFHYLDVNRDNKLEFVVITGDDEGCYMHVYTYSKVIGKDSNSSYNYYETVEKQELNYPGSFYTDNSSDYVDLKYVKISHNKLYALYDHWEPGSEYSKLRYGMLDYTRDKAKEIYFRPISFITLKKWNKL